MRKVLATRTFSSGVKIASTAGALSLYTVAFFVLNRYVAVDAVWSLICLIPLMVAAWFWGLWPGLASGVVAYGLTVAYAYLFDLWVGEGTLLQTSVSTHVGALLAFVFFGGIVGRMSGLVQQLKKAQEQLTTLEGILSICSSCSKIKDEKGYWRAFEEYVADRSNAIFSHTVCPECQVKLYPSWFYTEKK
jgi:hypothetical protein